MFHFFNTYVRMCPVFFPVEKVKEENDLTITKLLFKKVDERANRIQNQGSIVGNYCFDYLILEISIIIIDCCVSISCEAAEVSCKYAK